MLPELTSRRPGSLCMEIPTNYLKFAEECETLAKLAKTERHRNALIEMARVWKDLAADAEKRGTKKA
jgi:hypothetical protein